MGCKAARRTDQYHGWECTITEGECMFLYPDDEECFRKFGEGSKAEEKKEVKWHKSGAKGGYWK